jgi:RNA polymerase sigma factor (sigma-70 family)
MSSDPRRESAFSWLAHDVAGLIAAHRPFLIRFFRRCGLGRDESEDLTQETMLKALRTPWPCRDPALMCPWLRRIAWNIYLRWLSGPERSCPLAEAAEIGCEGEGALLSRMWLAEGLRRLPRRDRRVLCWHYLDGLSYEEIGSTLGVPKTTVTNVLYTARRRIRAVLSTDRQVSE